MTLTPRFSVEIPGLRRLPLCSLPRPAAPLALWGEGGGLQSWFTRFPQLEVAG